MARLNKTQAILNVIDGQHCMGNSPEYGLAAYHAARAVKAGLRKRGIGAQLAAVKHALNPYRVIATIGERDGESCILIYRQDGSGVSAKL